MRQRFLKVHRRASVPGRLGPVLMALTVLVCSPSRADDAIDVIHAEIDQAVWQPFKCAFEAMDGAALNALYAADVLRVTPDGLDTDEAFKTFNLTRFDAARRRGDSIVLDFWLDQRSTSPTTSYDVGFFRTTTIESGGATRQYFGQFHIVLRKEHGRWKIAQDWDSGTIAGETIGAEQFERGSSPWRACDGGGAP